MFTLTIRPKPGSLPVSLNDAALNILFADAVWQQDYPDYLQAWLVVEEFLLDEGWVHMLPSKPTPGIEGNGFAAPGAIEPTFFYGTNKVITDFQVIEILPKTKV